MDIFMKRKEFDKRYSGIWIALLLGTLFIVLSGLVHPFLEGTAWYLFSSLLRVSFGIVILWVGKRLYGKTAGEILSFQGAGAALSAGGAFLFYLVYYFLDVSLGIRAVTGLTAGLFLSKLLLQQISTGFYEELNYRFLVLEGFFYGKKSRRSELLYAFAGSLILLSGFRTGKEERESGKRI